MPYCPKCGKDVSSEARYCPFCGANLESIKDSLRKIVKGERDEVEMRREKIAETRHNEIIGFIAAAFGFFLWIIAAILSGITATRTEWKWGIIPVNVKYHPFAETVQGCVIGGVIMIIIGLSIAAYYAYQREKLVK